MGNEAVIAINGIEYRGDKETRSISPQDSLSRAVAAKLLTGEPVGPGVDEWAGLTATWSNYPASMIGAFLDLADRFGLTVDWFSDRGRGKPVPPPEPSPSV